MESSTHTDSINSQLSEKTTSVTRSLWAKMSRTNVMEVKSSARTKTEIVPRAGGARMEGQEGV